MPKAEKTEFHLSPAQARDLPAEKHLLDKALQDLTTHDGDFSRDMKHLAAIVGAEHKAEGRPVSYEELTPAQRDMATNRQDMEKYAVLHAKDQLSAHPEGSRGLLRDLNFIAEMEGMASLLSVPHHATPHTPPTKMAKDTHKGTAQMADRRSGRQ